MVSEIRAKGGDAVFVQCDISQKAQVDQLVKATVDHYGTIDIVVNNAGVNHSADFFDITEEDWDWVMGVDLKGTFLLSQAAARERRNASRISRFHRFRWTALPTFRETDNPNRE